MPDQNYKKKNEIDSDEVPSSVPPLEAGSNEVVEDREEHLKKEVPPDLVPQSTDEQNSNPDDDTTPFDDEKTGRAIDEITAKEGDDLLAAQDAAATVGAVKVANPSGFVRFWRSKWTLYSLLIILLGGAAAAMTVPTSRYWILNTAGVRAGASLTIVDSTTQLPLKGVQVALGENQTDTDGEGRAKFKKLRLGPAGLTIKRTGFKEIKREVVIGWGSNPLGSFGLQSTGIQYTIEVRDYLSEKPIEGVEATDGEATAISDKQGKITLTLGSSIVAKEGIEIKKDGYRTDKITLNEDTKKPTKVSLVLARKAIFVTKQSGKYDVYKSDIDGKNRAVLLPGTGHETSNVSLAVSPDGARAAYVSTRNNKRDSGGYLLSSLILINTDSGETVTIAEAPQIQLISWAGKRIVFQQSSSDSSSGKRYRISSYHYADNARLQLAAANTLTSATDARGTIYYAVAADAADSSVKPGLFSVGPDGKSSQQIIDKELSTVLRSGYDTFSLQTEDGGWYAYDIPDKQLTEVEAPASLVGRSYADNADHTSSLWISQSTLKAYDTAERRDKDVKSQSGLAYPLQWLSPTVAVYRVASGTETADYVISLEGGTARKIANVAPYYGFAKAQ